MRYEGDVFRPPSEADSLLIQATIGCSHNRCSFCAMYRDKRFRVRPLADVQRDIAQARDWLGPDVRRAFLCDGDAMVLPTRHLLEILSALKAAFPELGRVGIYANARDILKKSTDELCSLRDAGLGIAYLGMESGSDAVLKRIGKGATAAQMVAAVQQAMAAGIKTSVIYLLGLGGRQDWQEHALASARAVSQMNPNFLSALTVTVVPGTPLAEELERGEFELPDPAEFARELRLFLEHVDVRATIFRSNHASNYVPLSGRLPRDNPRLLAELDEAIRDHRFKPEYLRGL